MVNGLTISVSCWFSHTAPCTPYSDCLSPCTSPLLPCTRMAGFFPDSVQVTCWAGRKAYPRAQVPHTSLAAPSLRPRPPSIQTIGRTLSFVSVPSTQKKLSKCSVLTIVFSTVSFFQQGPESSTTPVSSVFSHHFSGAACLTCWGKCTPHLWSHCLLCACACSQVSSGLWACPEGTRS